MCITDFRVSWVTALKRYSCLWPWASLWKADFFFFHKDKKECGGVYLCCYSLLRQPLSKCSLLSSPAGDMLQVTELKAQRFLVLRDTWGHHLVGSRNFWGSLIEQLYWSDPWLHWELLLRVQSLEHMWARKQHEVGLGDPDTPMVSS